MQNTDQMCKHICLCKCKFLHFWGRCPSVVSQQPSSTEALKLAGQLLLFLSLLPLAAVHHVVHLWTAIFIFPYNMLLDCYRLWHALYPTWFRICLWISFCWDQLLHHPLLILVIQIISSFIGLQIAIFFLCGSRYKHQLVLCAFIYSNFLCKSSHPKPNYTITLRLITLGAAQHVT